MAIYITGDIHARPEQTLSSKVFSQGKTLTKMIMLLFVAILVLYGIKMAKMNTKNIG